MGKGKPFVKGREKNHGLSLSDTVNAFHCKKKGESFRRLMESEWRSISSRVPSTFYLCVDARTTNRAGRRTLAGELPFFFLMMLKARRATLSPRPAAS